MRKLLSFLVIALLFIGSMPIGSTFTNRAKASSVKAAIENKKATMLALKLYPAHSTRDGKVIGCDTANFAYGGSATCTDYRSFPWERKGTNNWGRYSPGNPTDSFLMPNAAKARDMGGTPIQVTVPGTMSTYPKFWGEFYLEINPDGTRSQERVKWYVVIDSAGQVWFDPDGQFNDPRYKASADPLSNTYVPGSITTNVMARIDPIRSNNTMGPYMINQKNADFRTKVYVWDRDTEWKLGTNRFFRLGWVDNLEYAREGGMEYNGTVSTGIVSANQFEVSTSVNWAWDPFNGKSVVPLANIVLVKQFPSGYAGLGTNAIASRTYYYDANSNNRYDADEFIYRKGNRVIPPTPVTPNTSLAVEAGDYRSTVTSVTKGGEVFTYAPSASNYIDTGDKDIALPLKPFMYVANPYFPTALNFQTRYYDQNNDNQYSIGELIYRVYGDFTRVKGGDVRLTNIFVTGNYVSDSTSFSTERIFAENDVLVLNEVLQASCADDKYDISVESNVWLGSNPSVTAATLRSPNKEFPNMTQRIQKNTVLDPSGNLYEVPASTFHDVKPFYREYLGIQIFRDNGVDNNVGINLAGDILIPQSLSDEYKAKRLGEEFLGASGGSMAVPDFARILTPFPEYVLYYDSNQAVTPVGQVNNRLGCGEALYQKKNNVIPTIANKIVQAGDLRLTSVTINSKNMITYPAGTIVMPGDADVSFALRDTYSTDTTVVPSQRRYYYKYYDAPVFNKLDSESSELYYTKSKQYEPGENIYFDTNDNSMVDIGDVRVSEVNLSGLRFSCGSTIEFAAEFWYNQSFLQMIPMGLNGDPRFMDIEVLPGKLDLKVDIDKPLKVEQTSTVKLSLGNNMNLKKGERVFIAVREPKMQRRTDVPPAPLFTESLYDDVANSQYIGITPGMTAISSPSAGGYPYYGQNFVSNYSSFNLWGSGNDGFKMGGVTYDNIQVTEDGSIALFRGAPKTNGFPSYAYEYIYDYRDYPSIGYMYGGRPYPYSAVNPYGNYYGAYSFRYLYTQESGSLVGNYTQCYEPWDDILKRGTWIVPFGGNWSLPMMASTPVSPQYYTTFMDYGVYWEKTSSYVRIVWKVCTVPFQHAYYGSALFNGPTLYPQLTQNTSEFEAIIYKSGTIQFNYSSKLKGKAGMNISAAYANQFLYNNDWDRGPINAPNITVPDPTPGNTFLYAAAACGYQYVPYKPIIAVSNYDQAKYVLSKYSYAGTSPIPNFTWLEGKSITFGGQEEPDVDLYNQRLFTAFGVIDQDHPTYEFQYTPYRGSCNDGFHGTNAFLAGTSIFNQLEIKAYIERGGILEPVPMDSDFTGAFNTNYKDPFWIRSKFNKKEYQENYRKEPVTVFAPEPFNTIPDDIDNFYNKGYEDLRNSYDCFFYQKLDIAPEELTIVLDKKCMDLASSKTPNISYRIFDKDNPNDVNDPANLPFMFPKWFAGYGQYPDSKGKYDYGTDLGTGGFGAGTVVGGGGVKPPGKEGAPTVPGLDELRPLSSNGQNVPKPVQIPKEDKNIIKPQAITGAPVGSYGRPLVMNFNAHGGGVDYLFTANCGSGRKYARYIVQVNTDGSYEFWRWFEYDLPGQVFGALDQHDVLYTNRGSVIPQGGQWDTISGGNTSYMVPDSWRLPAQFMEDMDGSFSQGSCKYLDDMFPPFGDITMADRYGVFGSAGLRNNPTGDPGWGYPTYYFPYPYPSTVQIPTALVTFGIPVVIMSPEDDFGGGIGLGVANPRSSDTPLTIRIYSNRAIFDYNSTVTHPEYFTFDAGEGIDYMGYTQMRILPLDPVINFGDMNIADRAMQRSTVNYTKGIGALTPLDPPTPQITSWYDPILYNWSYFTAYPGGQTHTGRAKPLDLSIRFQGEGRNSYPAIYDMYKKLGTEFFPLSDYGIFFSIRDAEKNHYTFDPNIQSNLLLSRVTIKGPFMTPKLYSPPDGKLDTSYRYKGIDNVPITYDTTGEIIIDATNQSIWEVNGVGFNRTINRYRSIPQDIPVYKKNKYARYTHSLYYGGTGSYPTSVTAPNADNDPGAFVEGDMPKDSQTPTTQYYYYYNYYYAGWYFYSPTATYGTVPYVPNAFNSYASKIFALDEIIPTGPGKITIEVETANGIKKVYQDCCQDQITDGITIDGLDIKVDSPKNFTVDEDNTLDLTVKEFNKKKDPDTTETCNDALLVVWQDRGAINPNTGAIMGAGDGWVTNPPRSSDFTNVGTSYLQSDDLNGNGKISYNDYETEILGSYDLATNTWSSGIIDARTFHRGNGNYRMELTQNNGSRLETVGMDFGGINLRVTNAVSFPDGVIGDDEVLPVIINAYKFGDDDNDRGFTPLYNNNAEFPQYSHEVYLAGRVEIPILSQNVYDVTVNPSPLTAGIQPELQDPTEPLTFNINDETGAPVDLLKDAHKMIQGVNEEDIDEISLRKAIWNALFKDPHPEPVPQYYWTRTDLHNDDGSLIGNTTLYSSDSGRFEPIKFDITQSNKGKYLFTGFVANDAGETDIYIYSADRRKMGKAKLKVVLPTVTYDVSNYDDPGSTEFAVPGSPDFVMTAGDNMIYKVHAYVKDGQGRPVKGLGRTVSVCSGGAQEVARFTPFATAMKNYYRPLEPWYWHFYGTGKPSWNKSQVYNGSFYRPMDMIVSFSDRWEVNMGIDLNNNGKLEISNNEIERPRPMRNATFYTTTTGSYGQLSTIGYAYYNTENSRYENGTYSNNISYDINAKLNGYLGWGLGSIYNRPYYTPGNYGMIFANFDKQGDDTVSGKFVSIGNTDSLNLNVDGETEFYVFGEDVCEVGGMVGKSSWSISPFGDVAGSPVMFSEASPSHMWTRYGRQIILPAAYRGRQAFLSTKDLSYRLDWDAMPSSVINIRTPQVEPLYADTITPLGKNMMDENNYDLTYGKENHILFRFYPADKRDIPLKDDIKMIMAGNQSEFRIAGRINIDPNNQDDPASTTMFITPTGTGLTTISLDLNVANTRKDMMRLPLSYGSNGAFIQFVPEYYNITDLARFDVPKGLSVTAISLSGPLSVNTKANLKILVAEVGINRPVEGATVTITGSGIKSTKTTDKDGLCYIDITPNAKEAIIVEAKLNGYVEGRAVIDIGATSDRKDMIQMEPIPQITNQNQYIVQGSVTSDVLQLTVNQSKVTIKEDRSFQYTLTLKEGMNTILVEIEDITHRMTRKILSIELRTKGPNLMIDQKMQKGPWIDIKEIELTGKVDPGSVVSINNQEAIVESNTWNIRVSLKTGKNVLSIIAKDSLGNTTTENMEIYVSTKRKVELFVGSKEAYVDGKSMSLEEAPFITEGRTYIPLKVISDTLGSELKWNAETRGITIIKDSTTIDMIVGSTKALVNNQMIDMDAPPIIRNGRTFIPVRFVSEILGAQVTWNARIKLIFIEILV